MKRDLKRVLIVTLATEDGFADALSERGETLRDEYPHGPPFSSARWFETKNPTIQRRCLRAVEALEREGLLKTWREHGDRLTNVRLTRKGRKLARDIVGPVARNGGRS